MISVSEHVPLAPLATFGIGGSARYFTEVGNLEQLAAALQFAGDQGVQTYLLGGASNLVFADGEIDRLFIKMRIGGIEDRGEVVSVGAGVRLDSFVSWAVESGREGLESLTSIPGSVGGALYGNAGAYGQSISDRVFQVSVWRGGIVETIDKRLCDFQYRHSRFKTARDEIIVSALFQLPYGNREALLDRREEIRAIRAVRWPNTLRCPGSFFKNILVSSLSKAELEAISPEVIVHGKIPAGFLLQSVGARGERFGGLRIAEFHGNLLLNDGRATYREVRQFADMLRDRVRDRFGISLEEEVQYVE